MLRDVPILKGEVVVREYDCLRMKAKPRTRKALDEPATIGAGKSVTANLIVTNKRIMYIAQRDRLIARGTSHFHQMNICDAGDVEMFDSRWRSLKGLIICLILGLLCTMLLGPAGFVLFLIIGFVWYFLFQKSLVYIQIGSKGSEGGIFAGNIGSSQKGTISFTVKPGADFDLMSRELGTLILDLQQNGDTCLYKWVLGSETDYDEEQA